MVQIIEGLMQKAEQIESQSYGELLNYYEKISERGGKIKKIIATFLSPDNKKGALEPFYGLCQEFANNRVPMDSTTISAVEHLIISGEISDSDIKGALSKLLVSLKMYQEKSFLQKTKEVVKQNKKFYLGKS